MSTPHEVLYNDAVGAMRASLSPLTSKEQRVLVELFLSQLKEDQRCLEIMVHLLTSQSEYHDDFIRMLSLTILNDWLKIWWNKISDQERSSLRNTVVMLVKGSVGKSPVKGLWTKLAVMISNIAVRQFPQQWPTFLNDMASLCAPGAADSSRFGEKEIALMSIEYLASDSIDTDYCSSLPLERRQDILAGFRENLPQLLSFAFSLMVDCSKVCGDLPPKGSAGVEGENLRAHLGRLKSGLVRMMIPIAMFARAEDVCDGKANRDFSMVAVMFLCEPEYQSDAVDLLNVITRHKLPFDVFSRLLEAIPGLSSPLLQPIPPSSTGGMSLPEDTAECMIFQRSYATMVFSIMSENISQATDKYYLQSTPRAQEILGNYVMLMAKLIGQPSRRLAGDVAKEWTKIFREDSIANIPWMSDVCAVLLQVYTSKLERILWIKEHVSSIDGDTLTMYPADEVSAAEFDDYDEWMDYMGALKAQVKSLCAVLAVKFPIVCLSFLQQKVTSLLSLPISVAKGDSNDAEDVIQWQAFATVLEFLCSNLMPAELTAGDEVSKQVLGQLHMMIELLLSWKPPAHSALLLQRLQCLNNCSAVLRSAPVDLLQRVFADLFRHDSVTLTAASSSAVSPTQLSEKAATIIAHLCQVCGEAVVGDVSLLNAIVAQIMNMISVRTQQRPPDQAGLQSLQNQRGCLRESLVALSERLSNKPAQQKELLVMSLADVVGKWQEIAPVNESGDICLGIYLSPQTLLDAAYINDISVSASKDTMGVILASSKRVSCASLPDATWAIDKHQALITSAQLVTVVDKALPFFAVWQAVIPGLRCALRTLHGTLDFNLRQTLAASNSLGLYWPPATLVRRAAGLPSVPTVPEDSSESKLNMGVSEGMLTVAKHLAELRVLMYQLLGQACSHKALYASAEHAAILSELGAVLPSLENNQLSQLMKTFVESYVLNAPPVAFDIVAAFLEVFLSTTFRRLSLCWDRSEDVEVGGQIGMCRQIYRSCSIPPGFLGLDAIVLENAKATICSELTRTYGDTLASFACCRGFLALDMPTSAALQSAAMLGISTVIDDHKNVTKGAFGSGRGKKAQGKVKKPDLKESDLDVVSASEAEPIGADAETRLKLHKALRRQALSSLLMSNPRYQQAVTAPFVASAVTLIGLPDTAACRRGISLGEYLATQCRTDRRLLTAVGKDAFSAALSVLLQQEAWSEGLETDVAEFLSSVYGMLVFGETVAPDGSILSAPSSSSSNSSQGAPKGQQSSGGFGSMSQWQGGGSNNSNSKSGSSSNGGGKGDRQAGTTVMLSDLPRRVLMLVGTITPAVIESFEKQMLGTMSKKKRRDYFKDMLKAAGVGRGSCVQAAGKRVDAAVMDIRQRINRHEVPRKPKDVGPSFFGVQSVAGLQGSDNDLNLSLFFGE